MNLPLLGKSLANNGDAIILLEIEKNDKIHFYNTYVQMIIYSWLSYIFNIRKKVHIYY